MKKELQMFVHSPPHGVSCWPNDEADMTHLSARKLGLLTKTHLVILVKITSNVILTSLLF